MRFLLLVFCVGIYGVAVAQSYTSVDSVKIHQLLDKADQEENVKQALAYAQSALDLSRKTGMLRGEGWANLKIAYLLVEHTENTDVKNHWSTAERIAQALNDPFMQAIADLQKGKFEMYNGNFARSEQLFQRALSEYFESQQSNYTAVLYNDLGMLAGRRANREEEVTWYLKAMKVYERTGSSGGWANTSGNLANAYYKLGKSPDAVRYAKEALAIHLKNGNINGLATVSGNLATMYSGMSEPDSAIRFQEVSLKYGKINGQKRHLIQGEMNLALLLSGQKRYQEAIEAIDRSIRTCYEVNDLPGAASKLRTGGEIAARMGDTALFQSYYSRATRLADSLNNREISRDILLSKSKSFEQAGNYRFAFENMKGYVKLKDSINDVQVKKNIAELEVKYETERRDLEIARLNGEKMIRQLELEKQRAVSQGNKILAEKKENEIREMVRKQKALEERQALAVRNHEQQIQLARQELQLAGQQKEIQEKELQRNRLLMVSGAALVFLSALVGWFLFNRYQLRRQLAEKEGLLAIRNSISKDLHDEVGSTLTNVNILNELTKRSLSDPGLAGEYLQRAGESIQQVSESLGDIVWNINPRYDDMDNLLIRMRRYASDMLDGAGIAYQLDFPEPGLLLGLSMDKRRNFYLIYKEVLNNLVKYSKASEARIVLRTEEKQLRLRVADNGVGFSLTSVKTGNGLSNMKQRAEAMGGLWEIVSQTGAGTSVELKFPLT